MLRFRDLGVFVFEFWVLRFRDLGASCFDLRFRVLRFQNYPNTSAVFNICNLVFKALGRCYHK